MICYVNFLSFSGIDFKNLDIKSCGRGSDAIVAMMAGKTVEKLVSRSLAPGLASRIIIRPRWFPFAPSWRIFPLPSSLPTASGWLQKAQNVWKNTIHYKFTTQKKLVPSSSSISSSSLICPGPAGRTGAQISWPIRQKCISEDGWIVCRAKGRSKKKGQKRNTPARTHPHSSNLHAFVRPKWC